jgi:type I restriction enzyme S subunit
MSSDWLSTTVEEIAANEPSAISIGPFGSRMKSECYVDSGAPVVMGSNISDGKHPAGDFVFVTEAKAAELKSSEVREGDLVFPHRGAIGRVALIPPNTRMILSSSLMKLTPNQEKCCSDFLLYFFRSNRGVHELLKNASTVGTPGIGQPLSSLKRIPLEVPPLGEQKAIAHILGTLDDKIELNRKTNETLEAMAKALFKSWFVDFDPVRAKAEGRPTGLPDEISDLFPDSFEDSELGEIPSGWKVSSLGEEFQWKEGKPWVKEDRVDFSANLVFGANGSIGYSTRQIANTRVIFVGKIGSCGAINFYNGSFWATNNTHYLTLEDNSDLEYIRQVLLGVDFSAYVGGSSNPYMPFGNFAQHQIASPPSRIISKYCEEVSPARSRIEQNTTESSLLSFLRDALLPKLISGEIRIPDAERLLEEVGV